MKKTDRPDSVSELVKSVTEDFETWRTARKDFDLQWQLNMDFMRGNQNNYISNFDTVVNVGKRFYWQQREVFNHISPLIEARLAKLTNIDAKGQLYVVPLGDSTRDKECAETSNRIIKSAFEKADIKSLADKANTWSEITGSAFYKVVWNNNGGRFIGEAGGGNVFEGDIEIVVCSPFEIYPDNLTAGGIGELDGIIHAKPYSVAAIKKLWGVDVIGGDVEIYEFNRVSKNGSAILKSSAMVIERYKNGRLTIVAGGKLLYDGTYEWMPFIRQTSERLPSSFFGRSVIERLIPVQRAYNSVKNRKTEFLNRLACGVLAVEDGSVDTEALENDGLAPGTVLVYKQGSPAPKFIESCGAPEFEREEERLLQEFVDISGGADIYRGENSSASGVALEIMVEQDRMRMAQAISSAQQARKNIAVAALKLYKKYAGSKRLERLADGGFVQLFTWESADIISTEVKLLSK
jgi:hypothetical protein